MLSPGQWETQREAVEASRKGARAPQLCLLEFPLPLCGTVGFLWPLWWALMPWMLTLGSYLGSPST